MISRKQLLLITILSIFTSNAYGNSGLEKMFGLMYSGFEYGYSMPKAVDYSASGLAKTEHSQRCAGLKYIAENRYCILGVITKARNMPELSMEEVINYGMGKVTELSKIPFTYIGYEHLTRTKK